MKFFTYTYNKSTSTGGIETVTRFLQSVASKQNLDIYEIYHGLSCEEIHPEYEHVHYIKMPNNDGNSNFFTKIMAYIRRRIVAYKYLKSNFSDTPGILVLHHPSLLNFIPRAVLKINKVILMQHNTFDIYFNSEGKLGFNLNYKYIDNIVVYTEKDKINLSSLFPNKNILDKTIAIPLACRFERLINTNENKYSTKLVTIARIEEFQKNFEAMCDAISLLPNNFTLDIYGSGTDEEVKKLQILIDKHPRVAFKGITKDVQKTLAHYSVFIMTSYFEGFGLTLIEARSQGLPLVVFNTFDALPSIITNGVNGFIVTPFDKDEFANSITKILLSKDEYLNFSTNALLKANETDSSHVSELWSKIFENK